MAGEIIARHLASKAASYRVIWRVCVTGVAAKGEIRRKATNTAYSRRGQSKAKRRADKRGIKRHLAEASSEK